MKTIKAISLVLGLLTVLSAQTINLTGTVTDCSGGPVAGADVTLVSYDLSATTDGEGMYEIIHTVGVRDVMTSQNRLYSLSGGQLQITLTNVASVSVAFHTIKGKLIENLDFYTLNDGEHRLPLPELKEAGLYVMTLQIGNTQYSHQVFYSPTGFLTVVRTGPTYINGQLAKKSAAVDSLEISASGFRGSTVPVDSLTGIVDAVMLTEAEFLEGGGECPTDALYMVTFDMIHAGFLLVFPNGETMLVDTAQRDGPDKMIAFFRANGITHIDYVQLSHSHGDHIGGIGPLTDAGFITDETHMERCSDFEIGDRFERGGASWYIYNADRGGNCDDNEDSLAWWMWYNGFRISSAGDEYSVSKREFVNNSRGVDLDEFFPVDVRNENHHCGGPWHDAFEERLNAKFSICPIPKSESTIDRLESGSRNERVIQQKRIHVIKVFSREDYEAFYCDSAADCPVEFNIPK